MTGAAIELREVQFSFGSVRFCYDVQIAAGEIVAVTGPSGSGKSTLLNLIAGFEIADAGQVIIGNEEVTALAPHQRPVTFVFQENNLFGHLDVAANIGLGRSASLRLSSDDEVVVENAIAQTGLTGKEKRLPAQLSGGERQRAALARALVRERPVLLLDEPFASLGPALRVEMLELVQQLHTAAGMTIVMVSHHPEDIAGFVDRILFVDEGRVAADGTPSELLDERSPSVAKYLGERKPKR